MTGKTQYIIMPISPLQEERFLDFFSKFSNKCRALLSANAPELYMTMEEGTGQLKFENKEQFDLFRQAVKNGVITGDNIFDFSRIGTPEQRMADELEYRKILGEIVKLKETDKRYTEKKKMREDDIAKGKKPKNYPERSQIKHQEALDDLRDLEERRKELGKKLGIDEVGDNNGVVGSGGGVRTGEDGKEIVVDELDR